MLFLVTTIMSDGNECLLDNSIMSEGSECFF